MKALILLLSLSLCAHGLQAQKPPIKFGDVSMEDLKMTRYDADSSAAAVILADYGESSITYNQGTGFSLLFERTTRIKILKKDGYEWANFEIPLYHNGSNKEKLSGLKAVTYNLENGKIAETKLRSDEVFEEKFSNNLDYTKVTLSDVREGSVVEITYKIFSDFLSNFQDWEFQSTIPVLLSEYRARIPEFFNYDKFMQGYVQLDISDQTSEASSIMLTSKDREGVYTSKTTFNTDKIDFQENRFRWAAKDIPAFKSEPYMTTYRDYIAKINFELAFIKFPNQPVKPMMGSWEQIAKLYYESEDCGGQVRGNGFLKKIVEEIISGATSEDEKIIKIHNYVKLNVDWNGLSRNYVSSSLKKVLEEKKGSSGEINLLLASMLEKAGIITNPILISTRDHGFVRENIPISNQFNSIICQAKVNDKILLLDATDKFLPPGILPERCLNGRGLIVQKEGVQWITIESPVKTKTFINVDLSLLQDGVLKGQLKYERTGYDASTLRKKYFSKGESEYLKSVSEGHSWELTKSQIENAEALTESFKELHELIISEHTIMTGDAVYLSPFVTDKIDDNPFKLETREYPVDFGRPTEKTYLCKITIPDNYQVEEIPQSKVLMLPGNTAKFVYNAGIVGNSISILASLSINKSLFPQTEYLNLREFFSQVVAKHSEQIVLKKK